jgi:hypothetical protein
VHRKVAELACELPPVKTLHFVDRTAIPWQAKDIGRDTLVRYHAGKTLLDLPFMPQSGEMRCIENSKCECARYGAHAPTTPGAEERCADPGLAARRKEVTICWQSSVAVADHAFQSRRFAS